MEFICHGVRCDGLQVSRCVLWCAYIMVFTVRFACATVCMYHGVHQVPWSASVMMYMCHSVHVAGFHGSWCACGMVYMYHSVYVSGSEHVRIFMCHGVHLS